MGACSSQSDAKKKAGHQSSQPVRQKDAQIASEEGAAEVKQADGGVGSLKRQITEKDNQIQRLLALLEKHNLDPTAEPTETGSDQGKEPPKPAAVEQTNISTKLPKTVSFRSEPAPENSDGGDDLRVKPSHAKKASVSECRQQRTFTSDAVMPSRTKPMLRHRIAIATRSRSKTERGANMPDGRSNEPQIKTTIKKLQLIGQTLGKMKRQITKFKTNDIDGVLSLPVRRSTAKQEDEDADEFDFSVSSDFLDADGDGQVDDYDAGRAGVELHEFELSNKAQEVLLRSSREHEDTFGGAFEDSGIQSLFETDKDDILYENSLLQLEWLMFNTEASISVPDVVAFERRITRIVRATRTVMSELEAFEEDDDDDMDYDMDEDALADAAGVS